MDEIILCITNPLKNANAESFGLSGAPGSRTGITRRDGSFTRLLTTTHISLFSHLPNPTSPRKTGIVSLYSNPSLSSACQGFPGVRFHLSTKFPIAGLSLLLWLRKTSYVNSVFAMYIKRALTFDLQLSVLNCTTTFYFCCFLEK